MAKLTAEEARARAESLYRELRAQEQTPRFNNIFKNYRRPKLDYTKFGEMSLFDHALRIARKRFPEKK